DELSPPHAEDGTAQVDVLAAGQFWMESRSHLDQRGQASLDPDFTGRRRRHLRQQLEDGALAGTVVTDDAERLAARDLEGDVATRPDLGGRCANPGELLEKGSWRVVHLEPTSDVMAFREVIRARVAHDAAARGGGVKTATPVRDQIGSAASRFMPVW